MCMIKTKDIIGSKVAWKIVEVNGKGHTPFSPFYVYFWKVGENQANRSPNSACMQHNLFEAFARREDARKLKKMGKYFKIIKIKFTENIIEGRVAYCARSVDGSKGIAGTVAIWDGKFHR